eukprot:365179-Chlamydomonas_euryale.AAC.9
MWMLDSLREFVARVFLGVDVEGNGRAFVGHGGGEAVREAGRRGGGECVCVWYYNSGRLSLR